MREKKQDKNPKQKEVEKLKQALEQKTGGKVRLLELKFNPKRMVIWLVVLFLALPFFLSLVAGPLPVGKVGMSQLLTDIKAGKVESIEVEEEKILIKYKDQAGMIESRKEAQESFVEILDRAGIDPTTVKFENKDISATKAWSNILEILLPVVLTGAIFLFIFRQARGSQDGLFSFGRSKAKLFMKGKQDVSFKDVAGVDEAKEELAEIVDFLKHPRKYKAMGARTPKGVILLGPSGVGKCVTGETLVLTNKGLIEIKDMPKYFFVDGKNRTYGVSVSSFDLKKRTLKDRKTSHWYNLGKQKTIKLTLEQGFEIEGTYEHPLVVMEKGRLKFKRLDQIKSGEPAALSFGQRLFGNREDVDEETAYLLGLLTGDGNLSIASRVGLTSADPETVKFFKKYIKKRFPDAKVYKHEKYDYIVTSWPLKKFLYQAGMSYLLSFDKEVPPSILQGKEKAQKAFISGLFDSDAHIQKGRSTIEWTTVSRQLARQIQMMLLNLGVVVSLNVKSPANGRHKKSVYRINITGNSLKVFAKTAGFRLPRKQRELISRFNLMKKSNTNVDLFYGLGEIVDKEWRQLSKQGLSNEFWARRIHHIRQRNRISRDALELFTKFCDQVGYQSGELNYFKQLLKAKLFFSPVKNLRKLTGVVYDFTVAKTHSFIGNGFINHNTLLARAVAGEAGVTFFSMAGSEFMEMLVGVGASRVRDLFDNAKKKAPAIIFIDEIDAIGRQRSRALTGGHDEREQTLNQILVEMDGFTPNDQVIVMAATNRGDLLDPALIRPGRFDRRIVLDMPDIEDRKRITAIHAQGKPFEKNVDWNKIAKRTVGFSGADIENMLNEAAILATRENKKAIDMKGLEEAALKVKLGPEKKLKQTKDDLKMTAYHEAGHAVVTYFLKDMDPVHRISIVSRGGSLGHTLIPPKTDRYTETRSHLMAQITSLLGGRTAENFIFKELTSGAASDISRATELARAMVLKMGMSELGPINYGQKTDFSDMGINWYEPEQISESMRSKIDEEVKKIVDKGSQKASEILVKHKDKLDLVAKELLVRETLESEEFEALMKKA